MVRKTHRATWHTEAVRNPGEEIIGDHDPTARDNFGHLALRLLGERRHSALRDAESLQNAVHGADVGRASASRTSGLLHAAGSMDSWINRRRLGPSQSASGSILISQDSVS